MVSAVVEVEEIGTERTATLLPWMWRIARIVLALMGWALFFYWWFMVFHTTSREARWISLIGLTPMAIAVPLGAWWWVWRNKRIAAHGRRGLISWYMSPSFEHDYFERPLEFATGLSAHDTLDLVLIVQAGRKIYAAAPDKAAVRGLSSSQQQRSTHGSTTFSDPRPPAAA
jgi:hypothetical protein